MSPKEKSKKTSPETAVMLLVVGLILGSVFVFGSQYWSEPMQNVNNTTVWRRRKSIQKKYLRYVVMQG